MSETKIEWCSVWKSDSSPEIIAPGFTHNFWIGCEKVSPACRNCYAETYANKYARVTWGQNGSRSVTSPDAWLKPAAYNRKAIKLRGEFLTAHPGRPWQRLRVFSNSLSDVGELWSGPMMDHMPRFKARKLVLGPMFYRDTKDGPTFPETEWWHYPTTTEYAGDLTMGHVRLRMFDTIRRCPEVEWLLLTKRPATFRGVLECRKLVNSDRLDDTVFWLRDWHTDGKAPDNVRLGVTIESYDYLDRLDQIVKTPASGYFISCEPLLTRIDFRPAFDRHDKLIRDGRLTVIVGGESGDGVRPTHPAWVREVRDACAQYGVPFFFKAHGDSVAEQDYRPEMGPVESEIRIDTSGRVSSKGDARLFYLGRECDTGRHLDGRLHNGFAPDRTTAKADQQPSLFGD